MGPFRLYSRRTTFKVIILAMFGIKLKLDSRRICSWLFFDSICIMGWAKRRQSGGTSGRPSGRISLMSSLPVDETAHAYENRRHCSRPYFALCLPGVISINSASSLDNRRWRNLAVDDDQSAIADSNMRHPRTSSIVWKISKNNID